MGVKNYQTTKRKRMINPHQITEEFEKAVCDYTGAPYCVALDNGSSALFLALMFDNIRGKTIMGDMGR